MNKLKQSCSHGKLFIDRFVCMESQQPRSRHRWWRLFTCSELFREVVHTEKSYGIRGGGLALNNRTRISLINRILYKSSMYKHHIYTFLLYKEIVVQLFADVVETFATQGFSTEQPPVNNLKWSCSPKSCSEKNDMNRTINRR